MRQLKNTALFFSAFSAIFAPITAAEDMNGTSMSNFSYNYFDARLGVSPVTYGAGLSMSIHPNAHIRVQLDTEFESDFASTAAVGFHAPVNDWADIYGEIGMRAMKQENQFNGDTKFGVEVLLGARQWLGPQLEVGADIGHVSIDSDDKVFGGVSARFHATELFSVGIAARINDSYGDQAMFTTRFKF